MHTHASYLFRDGRTFFSHSYVCKTQKNPWNKKSRFVTVMEAVGGLTMRILWLVVCSFLLSTGLVHAQLGPESLKGLIKIKLWVEPPDDTARACGVTEELVTAAFMDPARSSALRVTNNAVDPIFSVQVNAIDLKNGMCVSDVTLQLLHRQLIRPDFSADPRYVTTIYWSESTLAASAQYLHAEMVKNAIESHTTKFIAKWNSDNKARQSHYR